VGPFFCTANLHADQRNNIVAAKTNIFVVILKSGEYPVLSRPQMYRLAKAHNAHAEYMKNRESLDDSDDDDGPQDEHAWLLEDLKVLAFLYTRLRDREILIDLIFEVCLQFLFLVNRLTYASSPRVSLLNCLRISSPYFTPLLRRYIVLPVSQTR
jgi:hypothetical protein